MPLINCPLGLLLPESSVPIEARQHSSPEHTHSRRLSRHGDDHDLLLAVVDLDTVRGGCYVPRCTSCVGGWSVVAIVATVSISSLGRRDDLGDVRCVQGISLVRTSVVVAIPVKVDLLVGRLSNLRNRNEVSTCSTVSGIDGLCACQGLEHLGTSWR
jgi:hypothetical protein